MSKLHARPNPRTDELLEQLVRLADEALKRTKLQQARIELAMALQRTMLPDRLPDVSGLRTAARYAPARQGLEVGGDWYDAFLMPDGTVGLAIGDVQGHDVEAAALVGQVRTGLRVVTRLGTDPGEVLAQVNDLLVSVGSDLFVTCAFFRFDPASGELADARAGHVPTIRVNAQDRAEILLDAGGLPLGIFPGEKYPVTRRTLTEHEVFVLLTDGVVEGPSFPIGEGLRRVADVARAEFGVAPEVLADDVMAVADLTGHSDDAAVLVLRHDRMPASGGP